VLRNLVSNALKFTPRGGSVSVSAVFVPSKDDSNRILSGSKSASGDSFVMRLMGSSTVTITDHVQDLETGIRSEDGILHNHIDETHSDSTIEDENDIAYGKLLIVVRDSGVGMSKENQKRLFHEVVQFNPEVLQAGGGSGLGLWITNNIVNMHDGKVSVYSAGENSGCSFSVEVDMQRKIPKLHCDDPAPIEISRTLQAFQAVQALRCDGKEMETMDMGVELGLGCMDHLTGLTAVASNYRRSSIKSLSEVGIGIPSPRKPIYNILMVDDSGLNRKLLGKLLRSAGHVVEEAEDGLQAVEVMKTRIGTDKEYDIILMDFIMPKMDGPSATKAIRALGYTSPIFGVTGNAVDSDVEHFLGHGADRVMIKPFDLQLFNQNITEMIAARDSLSNCG
jgi:CheY-like chemotaxis protein